MYVKSSAVTGLCTPHVVAIDFSPVHHGYMAKRTTAPAPQIVRPRANAVREVELPWRPNKISTWRDKAGLTHQEVSDHLASLDPPILLGRNSIGRIENGKQRPAAVALEAMAALYNTDVDCLTNMTPDEAGDVLEFKAMEPAERRLAISLYHTAKAR